MPNKTLYVRDSEKGIWERAKFIAGGELSQIIIEYLRRFIAEHEKDLATHPVGCRCNWCKSQLCQDGSK